MLPAMAHGQGGMAAWPMEEHGHGGRSRGIATCNCPVRSDNHAPTPMAGGRSGSGKGGAFVRLVGPHELATGFVPYPQNQILPHGEIS